MDRISLKFLSEFHFVVAFIHLPLSLSPSLSLSLSLSLRLSFRRCFSPFFSGVLGSETAIFPRDLSHVSNQEIPSEGGWEGGRAGGRVAGGGIKSHDKPNDNIVDISHR